MIELDSDGFYEQEITYDHEFSILRDKLSKVNKENVTKYESIDSLYIAYITLLNHVEELELNKGYRILSDKITYISKLLNKEPFGINKYLGFTLIMSIWILKSEDWYNLDDLCNIDICNIIIDLIIDYCKRSINTTYIYEYNRYCLSNENLIEYGNENLYFDLEEEFFIDKKKRYKILECSVNKKRKLCNIFSNEYDKEFRHIISEITKRNFESICSIIGKDSIDDLFKIIEDFEFDEDNKNLIFNKIYFLNAMICFYRCSGSFLNIALTFKLPRGRYLLENGVDITSSYILNEMMEIYQNISRIEDQVDGIIIQIINDISVILWFKIFEMKISMIINSNLYESINDAFDKHEVNKEYLKLEILNKYSVLINVIIKHYTNFNVGISNKNNYLINFYNKIKKNTIKIIFDAIYKSFNVPFINRNYFMTHFHVTEIINSQILNLLFNIGYMTQLSIQNTCFDQDIVIYILKTYLSTIYLISRFGDSSTKEIFLNKLISGLNNGLLTEIDVIYENIKNFLYPFNNKSNSNKKYYIYIFLKFSYTMAMNIKNSLVSYDENHIKTILFSHYHIQNESITTKHYFVINQSIYYKIASLTYTLNFINIMLNHKQKENLYKKRISMFIEKIISNIFTKQELNQIICVINNELSIYKFEKRIFDYNFVFEHEFIKNYLSRFLPIKIVIDKNSN